jgi:hypothetical protein
MDINHMPVAAKTLGAFRRYLRMVPAFFWARQRGRRAWAIAEQETKELFRNTANSGLLRLTKS